jgi:hypothetical protein
VLAPKDGTHVVEVQDGRGRGDGDINPENRGGNGPPKVVTRKPASLSRDGIN